MGNLTNFPSGLSSMGVPLMGRQFGKTYFVDSTNGSDQNRGLNNRRPFKTLTKAFATVTHYDTIMLSGGDFTGNYTTPANADAAFVTVRGFKIGPNGLATWMGPTTHTSPIIDLKSRGWTFTDIEFDCPTGAGGINMNKSLDGTTDRPDFMTVENCIFTTGKLGIVVDGGSTYATIRNCRFDQMTTSGAYAISVDNTDHHLPQHWLVENNQFMTNVNHIGPDGATKGWMNSTFRGNVFLKEGVGQSATTIFDIRDAGGGGNVVIDNYFDIAKASFQNNATLGFNATDYAAGNHFSDGEQQESALT
jgi:hypothetical protein